MYGGRNKLPRSYSLWNMMILPILGHFPNILAHPGLQFLVTYNLKVLNMLYMNSMVTITQFATTQSS